MIIESAGDFSALFREQYDDLLRFVRRRAPEHVVDDIVAETFLIAWRSRAEIPDAARPWLFRTARNVLLNASRGLGRQVAVAVRIGAQRDEVRGISIEDHIDLQAAWRTLPELDREILALDVWEGLRQAEAAAVLGCSRAAYAMRLTRARRRLTALMNPPASG